MENRVRTIALVGNGPVDPGYARFLESHDLIIRFNDCRNYRDCPTRTDVIAVCNIGRSAEQMIFSSEWRAHPAVREASQIWSAYDPVAIPGLKRQLLSTRPELVDLCDDYTYRFELFSRVGNRKAEKRHDVIGDSIRQSVVSALQKVSIAPFVTPSTGIITLAAVLTYHPDAIVTLTGFSHEGWSGHPFAGEQLLIAEWSAKRPILKLVPKGRHRRARHEPLHLAHIT